VRSSFSLFSIIKGAPATQPIVPIKPETKLAINRIEGSRRIIGGKLKKFEVKLTRIAFFGPNRSQKSPAGSAIIPVAMVLAVKMLLIKSGLKPIALRLR